MIDERLPNEPRGQSLEINSAKKQPDRSRRGCTDAPWLVLFVCFLGGWAGVAQFAISNGELGRIWVPVDSVRRLCGITVGVENKPYALTRFNIEDCNDLSNCVKTLKVCVESCPQKNFKWGLMNLSVDELKQYLICLPGKKSIVESYDNMDLAISENRCLDFYAKSSPILDFCIYDTSAGQSNFTENLQWEELIPTQLSTADGVKDMQLLGLEILQDVLNSWPVVLTALGVTLLSSLLFIALLRWLAAYMLCLTVMGTLTGLLCAIYASILRWTAEPTEAAHGLAQALKDYALDCSSHFISITAMCLCCVGICASLLLYRRRILTSITLTKTSSKMVFSSCCSMFFPVLSWLLFIAASVFAFTVHLYLIGNQSVSFQLTKALTASGTPSNEDCECEGPAANYTVGGDCSPQLFVKHCHIYGPNGEDPTECKMTQCSYSGAVFSFAVISAFAYNFFVYCWVIYVIFALSDLVLAATFSSHWLTNKGAQVTFCLLARKFMHAIRYHLGTLAFGFLLLSPCRQLSRMLNIVGFVLKKFNCKVGVSATRNKRCCYLLREQHLQSLNSKAYIMCAIHGSNLLASIRLASHFIACSSRKRLPSFDPAITKLMLTLYKLLLTTCAGLATYFFLHCYPSILSVHYNLVPALLVTIGAYPAVSVCFDAHAIAADTLALCHLEDCVLNAGLPDRPFTMTKQLRNTLRIRDRYGPPSQITPQHMYPSLEDCTAN